MSGPDTPLSAAKRERRFEGEEELRALGSGGGLRRVDSRAALGAEERSATRALFAQLAAGRAVAVEQAVAHLQRHVQPSLETEWEPEACSIFFLSFVLSFFSFSLPLPLY